MAKSIGAGGWVLIAVVAVAVLVAIRGPSTPSTPAPAQPEAQPTTTATASADKNWESDISSTGLKRRTQSMDFEVCVAAKNKMVVDLGIPSNRVIEIVASDLMTMTRVCLDGASTMLISCSKPDSKVVFVESPQRSGDGCPG